MLHARYEDGPEHDGSQSVFDRLQLLHVVFEVDILAAINKISRESIPARICSSGRKL